MSTKKKKKKRDVILFDHNYTIHYCGSDDKDLVCTVRNNFTSRKGQVF